MLCLDTIAAKYTATAPHVGFLYDFENPLYVRRALLFSIGA